MVDSGYWADGKTFLTSNLDNYSNKVLNLICPTCAKYSIALGFFGHFFLGFPKVASGGVVEDVKFEVHWGNLKMF